MKFKTTLVALLLCSVVPWLDARAAPGDVTPAPLKNVLFILADDIGVDILSSYNEGNGFPVTPTLDRLSSEGVLFRNAWSTPKCSPTRATVLTGRYGFRTGIGGLVTSVDLHALSTDEIIIPEVLQYRTGTHQHAMFGKWHLGNCLNGLEAGPNLAGFSHFAGAYANLVGNGQSFFRWRKTVNGERTWVDGYITTDTVDDTISWINQQTEPWFVYLPFHAPHQPFQIPPHNLVSPSTLDQLPKDSAGNPLPASTLCEGETARICYLAMVEAMDAEIGRLLNAIPPEVRAQTTIIFVGDNGTPGAVTRAPFDPSRAKSTLFEAGINVPLIIQGAGVVNPSRESAALVNTTDMFATILELATGRAISEFLPPDLVHDSVSLVPILNGTATDAEHRPFVYTELFHPTRTNVQRHFGYTMRNERYKLIRLTTRQRDEFYDLVADPFETNNLLLSALNEEQTTNLQALEAQLTVLRAPTENVCPIESLCTDCERCVVSDVPSDACARADTGVSSCQRPDASLFSCPAGKTIHTVRCPCTGGPGPCGPGTRFDQQLVCR